METVVRESGWDSSLCNTILMVEWLMIASNQKIRKLLKDPFRLLTLSTMLWSRSKRIDWQNQWKALDQRFSISLARSNPNGTLRLFRS